MTPAAGGGRAVSGDYMNQLLARLHVRPATARHLRENQGLVVQGLQVRGQQAVTAKLS